MFPSNAPVLMHRSCRGQPAPRYPAGRPAITVQVSVTYHTGTVDRYADSPLKRPAPVTHRRQLCPVFPSYADLCTGWPGVVGWSSAGLGIPI